MRRFTKADKRVFQKSYEEMRSFGKAEMSIFHNVQ